ncbi:MAG: hypothetical protein ACFFEF_13335 [Candidatus Thorarchaeota archaeon]
MSPDWLVTRVAVVLLSIVGPIYFFLLMWMLPFQMVPFGDPFYDFLFHFIAAPTIFSLTWVGYIYYARFRLANTVQLFGETTTTVPLRWRIFYGTNAAFVIGFFILPMIIAPLAILSGLIVAGHVFYRVGVGKLGGGKAASAIGVLVALALCILPALVMLQFTPGYLQVWDVILESWSTFWFQVVYGFAQCLVNALSFAAPIHFIYFGAQQYDRGVYGRVYTNVPTTWIRIGQIILFLVFLTLYLPDIPLPGGMIIDLPNLSVIFTSFINYISLAIVVILILLKQYLGVRDDSTLGSPVNIVIVGLFLIVEIFFKFDVIIVTVAIWLAFLLFASLFAVNYMRASSREMY